MIPYSIDRFAFTRKQSTFMLWLILVPVYLVYTTSASSTGEDSTSNTFDWRTFDPTAFPVWSQEVLSPDALKPNYWHIKPKLCMTYYYDIECIANDTDRDTVLHFLAGEFRPYPAYDWIAIGVPPPWDVNPLNNNTWDFYRHSLRWLAPLVTVWKTDGSEAAANLLIQTLRDWIDNNSNPPGASQYAWYDHAVASRLRFFTWFWEVWRTTDAYDPVFAQHLLGSVYQHALYACDPEVYPARSNHGLEMDAALLAAATTFPEFKEAATWRELAIRRACEYARTRFSVEGFHLEQSPFYHWYVLDRFNRLCEFLHGNRLTVPQPLIPPLQRMAAVWPFLLKPDGTLPIIGDTPKLRRERNAFNPDLVGGPELVRNCIPKYCNPRNDDSTFLLSFEAGYAIFSSQNLYAPVDAPEASDTYALFKCNNFPSPHYHHDALSFIIYGYGNDWLVDSGQLNYEEHSPERQYMRSARAHNIVLIDQQDFSFNPLTLIGWGRTQVGDFVAVRHELETAHHTRTFRFIPPNIVELEDEVVSVDGRPHSCTLLFHIAPDLTSSNDGAVVTLLADSGARCTITQLADTGSWSVIQGQREPTIQGWYSPSYNELLANSVWSYSSTEPALRHVFKTRIELTAPPKPATSAPAP